MSNSYTQIYIQIVFAVRGRQSLIHSSWEEGLFKYISGIVRNKEQKLLAINGMPDHIHILIGMRPSCCLSNLIREIKKASNQFVNHNGYTSSPFHWQEGYGAFSYSHSALDKVVAYIQKQKIHHRKKTFRDEYKEFLMRYDIEYKDEYLFDWID